MADNSLSFLLSISQKGLLLILILSAPTVLVAMLVGLTISLFQATTQIQEQTLTFVPKLIAVMATVAITGKWSMENLVNFARTILDEFPKYIR